jgi:hypothetical protein
MAIRRRPRELGLRRADGSVGSTSGHTSSRGVRGRTGCAQAALGFSRAPSAPWGANGGAAADSGSREEKAGWAFIGSVPWRGDHESRRTVGRGMGQRRCERRRPMAACGRWDGPMAKGGATGRRIRAQRVARIRGPQYHTQERLGAADGPTVAGLPRRARTAAYGREADMAECDVVRARVPTRSGAKQFGVALFRRVFLKIFELKSANL